MQYLKYIYTSSRLKIIQTKAQGRGRGEKVAKTSEGQEGYKTSSSSRVGQFRES